MRSHPVSEQAVPARWDRARARARAWGARSTSAVLVVLALAAAVESVSASSGAATSPPPGRLLRVGGVELHLHCTGTAAGAPTVLLEAGLGEPAMTWASIQDALDGEVRVCSYDRAGHGWSSAREGAWTASSAAADLDALLGAGGVDGPVVVVAHSVGALVVRALRQEHPERVAALVLIDPTDDEAVRAAGTPTLAVVERRVLQVVLRLGVLRWTGRHLVPRMVGASPPAALVQQLPALYHQEAVSASVQELVGALSSAQDLARGEDRAWGELPVIVVSAASAPARDVHAHQVLAARSSRGVHVRAPQGGHYVHYAAAGFVVDVVRQALTAAAAPSPGSPSHGSRALGQPAPPRPPVPQLLLQHGLERGERPG